MSNQPTNERQSETKNFGLTEQEFSNMLHRLQAGDESLFENIFITHFERCLAFLKRSHYKVPHEDAYDCCMWTVMRFREMLLDGKLKYGSLESYFTRMAVTRYLKNKQKDSKLSFTEEIPDIYPDETDYDPELINVLEKAWKFLGDSCQVLLQGYYYDKKSLKELTVILGDTSEANTRKRKERCLAELRKLFFKPPY